jgi:hypothetical protein
MSCDFSDEPPFSGCLLTDKVRTTPLLHDGATYYPFMWAIQIKDMRASS